MPFFFAGHFGLNLATQPDEQGRDLANYSCRGVILPEPNNPPVVVSFCRGTVKFLGEIRRTSRLRRNRK